MRAGIAISVDPRGAVAGSNAASEAMARLRNEARALTAQVAGVGAANDNLARQGARHVLQQMGGAYTRAASAALTMRSAVAGVVAVLAVREILAYAESWRLVEGRLQLVVRTTGDVARVQGQLFEVAQRSRAAFEETAELYARVARSSRELGLSQRELLTITETINQAFIVSGTSADSAKAALIQLGQGFASGVLRGEELNSVLEQAPRLAEAIATGMGVTVGQLRALGAEGKLTAKAVADALLSQREAIEREFGKMPTSVGQSVTNVSNSIGRLVGQLDAAVGFSRALAGGLQAVSGWLDRISDSGGPASTLAEMDRAVAGYRSDLERIPAGSRDPVLRDRRRFAEARLATAASGRDALADDLRRLDRFARQRDAAAPDAGSGAGSAASSKSSDVLRDLQHERDLLQQTARERAISNALKKADIDLNAELSPAQKAVAGQIAAAAGALHDYNVVQEASNQAAEIATAQAQEHEKALIAAKDRSRDLLRAQDDRLRDLKEEGDLAREEVQLLGLSEREREVELRLRQEINRERREGLPLSGSEIELRKREIESIVASREAVRRAHEIVGVSEDIADSLIENFRRAGDEGESRFKQMADGILATLEDLAFEAAKQAIIVPIIAQGIGAITGIAPANGGMPQGGLFGGGGVLGLGAAGGPIAIAGLAAAALLASGAFSKESARGATAGGGVLVGPDGRFFAGNVGVDNGGDPSSVKAELDRATTLLNQLVDATGAKLSNDDLKNVVRQITVGTGDAFTNDVVTFAKGGSRGAEDVVRDLAKSGLFGEVSDETLAKVLSGVDPAVEKLVEALAAAATAVQQETKAKAELIRETERNAAQFRQLQMRLSDAIVELNIGSGSTLSPVDRLTSARGVFTNLVARARTGDAEAIGKLPGVTGDFLDASRAYNASSAPFQQDRDLALATLKEIEDLTGGFASEAERQVAELRKQTEVLAQILAALQKPEGPDVEAVKALVAAAPTAISEATKAAVQAVVAQVQVVQQAVAPPPPPSPAPAPGPAYGDLAARLRNAQSQNVLSNDFTTESYGGGAGLDGVLRAVGFADGGVSTGPQLAMVSEGRFRTEAHVPLPDGRSIPVTLNTGDLADRIDRVVTSLDAYRRQSANETQALAMRLDAVVGRLDAVAAQAAPERARS